ncbi:MAG: hypothetical protein QM687_17075 [Ferruginibacter sp.]
MFTKTDIEKYFIAEKNLGLLFIIIGIVGIIAAVIFFFVMKTNWHKGAAIPFLLIGLFQLSVGYKVYSTADNQRKAAAYAYDMNPSELTQKELPKMETALKSINTFIVIEAVLLLAGIGLFIAFKKDPSKIFWAGLGMALFIEAALCLFSELTAKAKTQEYAKGLKEFVSKN